MKKILMLCNVMLFVLLTSCAAPANYVPNCPELSISYMVSTFIINVVNVTPSETNVIVTFPQEIPVVNRPIKCIKSQCAFTVTLPVFDPNDPIATTTYIEIDHIQPYPAGLITLQTNDSTEIVEVKNQADRLDVIPNACTNYASPFNLKQVQDQSAEQIRRFFIDDFLKNLSPTPSS